MKNRKTKNTCKSWIKITHEATKFKESLIAKNANIVIKNYINVQREFKYKCKLGSSVKKPREWIIL